LWLRKFTNQMRKQRERGSMPDTTNQVDEWLTPVELSQELKVPVPTLYQWQHRGTGPPAHKIGKHLRYRRGAFEEWLAAQMSRTG
jgi:excisionase family DNA binding protein